MKRHKQNGASALSISILGQLKRSLKVFLGCGYVLSCTSSGTSSVDAGPDSLRDDLVPVVKQHEVLYLPGLYGSSVFGRDAIARSVIHEPLELGFDLVTQENDPISGKQYTWYLQNPTSFGVKRVSAIDASTFFVAGTSRRGETVIERWNYPPQDGAWFTDTPSPSVQGVPSALTAPVVSLHGTAWIKPSERAAQAPARRTEIYEGSEIGSVWELLPDPEGRFLLVVEKGTNSVFQVFTDTSTPPAKLFDGSGDQLAQALGAPQCDVYQSGLLDRIYVVGDLRGAYEGPGLVLSDSDNDGIFDSLVWLSALDFEALAPPSNWKNYWFQGLP